MRLLFAVRHAAYVRFFRSTLEVLDERGHEVVLVVGPRTKVGEGAVTMLDRLGARLPGLTVREGVEQHRRGKRDLASALRLWLAYLWFLEPGLEKATKARIRVRAGLPPSVREAIDAAAANDDFCRSLSAVLEAVESLLPVPNAFGEVVADAQADAVVVSPLLEYGAPQVNYLRAARQLGLPTGLCVASWDNLTSKGRITEPVDLVAVWNEVQAQEAVELHRVPRARVAVTGAPLYDEWFGREPATRRGELCARVGLSPERPYLLYVGSSGFVAPGEARWILQWLETVRRSGLPELADVQVVVRPHPNNPLEDGSSEVERLLAAPGVVVCPSGRSDLPITEPALATYYDMLHHAAAVVGVNTSAMIEAALAGRGVYSLLAPCYRQTQEDSPHFAHLRRAGGGLIHATPDAAGHAVALARALRGDDAGESAECARRFLAAFIRPHGLDRPAAPLLADALEALAAVPRRPPERLAVTDQEWLNRLAAELEPVFHIGRGQSLATREARRRRKRAIAHRPPQT